jgi:hypothetical protein
MTYYFSYVDESDTIGIDKIVYRHTDHASIEELQGAFNQFLIGMGFDIQSDEADECNCCEELAELQKHYDYLVEHYETIKQKYSAIVSAVEVNKN